MDLTELQAEHALKREAILQSLGADALGGSSGGGGGGGGGE